MEYEQTKGKKYKNIKIQGHSTMNFIKVWNKNSKLKATYKATKALHTKEIKQARADIRKHKLLIKQAKLTYKLSK